MSRLSETPQQKAKRYRDYAKAFRNLGRMSTDPRYQTHMFEAAQWWEDLAREEEKRVHKS